MAKLALKETGEFPDPEDVMESLALPETPAPLAPLDHPAPLDLEGTLLLRWLEVSTRKLEVLRWA